MIVGAAYTLWMYKRVVFGAVANHHVAELTDINKREFLILALLAAMAPGHGPLSRNPFTEVMHSSVNELLRHVAVSKIQ
jgi:NADH-quinone oxidoreductase subunit M